jgi:hypothetical protein
MYLSPVGDPFGPCHACTVGAAVEVTFRLDAMADHLNAAILASGSQSMDCTLEAVEGARLAPRHTYLEGLGVKYATHNWTHSHGCRSTIAQTSRPLSIGSFYGLACQSGYACTCRSKFEAKREPRSGLEPLVSILGRYLAWESSSL